jgi:hypothetical protein
MRAGFYTLKGTVGIENTRNLPTWHAWTKQSANPAWKSPPSGSLWSKRSQYPRGKEIPLAHSLLSYIFHSSLQLHTHLLFWFFFLAPISGFSWFLFLLCCWFIVSDSICYWIISSYLCFWVMNFFEFFSLVIANFSNISRCPNPILGTYSLVPPLICFHLKTETEPVSETLGYFIVSCIF